MYYHNVVTQTSVWEKPAVTQTSVWEKPAGFDARWVAGSDCWRELEFTQMTQTQMDQLFFELTEKLKENPKYAELLEKIYPNRRGW